MMEVTIKESNGQAPESRAGTVRVPQLDLLRSFAVLMVLWYHFSQGKVAGAGWSGVQLFFVLSGFLVSGLLFTEYQRYGDVQVKRFLVRRAFKIYPSFWVLIFATTLLEPWKATRLALVSELGFIQNYGPGMWRHTWTLAVEEHFYIALALVVAWLAASRRPGDPFRSIPAWGLVLAILTLGFRVLTVRYLPARYKMNDSGTHLHADALGIGVVLSYWYHHGPRLRRYAVAWRFPILAAAAVALAPTLVVANDDPWMRTVGLTLLPLAFAGILAVFLTSDRAQSILLGRNPIAWFASLGIYSYGIYLWHQPAANWLVYPWVKATFTSADPKAVAWTCVAVSVLLGVVMTWAVEYPCLRLRDMLAPRRLLTLPTLCVAATPAEVATARADAELILSAEGALHLKPVESG